MKIFKLTIAVICSAIVLMCATSGAHNIYMNNKITMSMAEEMCSQAKTKQLYCFCYEAYYKACPLDK